MQSGSTWSHRYAYSLYQLNAAAVTIAAKGADVDCGQSRLIVGHTGKRCGPRAVLETAEIISALITAA